MEKNVIEGTSTLFNSFDGVHLFIIWKTANMTIHWVTLFVSYGNNKSPPIGVTLNSAEELKIEKETKHESI
jgi:hypothetical protein